ncbi:hypothetical protein [Runella salmonicolor]|uniref:Uncharacterized protein n=1 Tax=Runella salmonicolor TaxID=2950278 RepID=A0ABT1FJH1_9BACT|nr:hypothetical protein [Runella salmonicolor]MCP1381916.1 hypothetical protein [Runella salmonicolor]
MNYTTVNINSEVNTDDLILPENLQMTLDEIENTGDNQPIIVNADYTIISGISTYLLAIKEGKEKIIVKAMSRFSKINVLDRKAA